MKSISFVLAACLLSGGLFAENLLENGGFEKKGKGAKALPGFDWIHPSKQQFYDFDTQVKHSGERSLRISNVNKTWIGFIAKSIPLAEFKKPLVIRGWAKYENLVEKDAEGRRCGMPFIGIWSLNQAGRNSLSISIPVFAEGSRDWFFFEQVFTPEEFKKRSAHLTGDRAPKSISFRINVSSQPGTVWFDDLEYAWLEPKALQATLPLRDVTGETLQVQTIIADTVADGKISVAVDGKEIIPSQAVKAGKVQISVSLAGVTEGKHTLCVRPVAGFPEGTEPVNLEFTRQPDAFAE